ncbi:double-stranded uracil-DNA glycosylase [Niastella yeongjuensis]|uniref:Double-stranded uracil-DNA glycosylase n=1 Tax=Niastella yeongjuensis TaxID=354355 RepID=A0A1V9EA38_9BACT|nr:G/U mismatch-specific DNA glycosylase [Niastella yeongjuensis]OQP42966.1 double-stranded uracil-DNA glycosylase [Niastella yeongjuensis]SEO61219.1 G/U mismatch-specific uracil-DNA glycosylase [Niastella yeongjuensis]
MNPQLTDILSKNLEVVFCGINPGLKSAMEGHHFSNRSNRFWRVLHQSGFTPYEIEPRYDTTILTYGYGLTTAVARATVRADELSKNEFDTSVEIFKQKIEKYKPARLAFLGKPAWQAFSGLKTIEWGLQEKKFCDAIVWVLPNPSGLNRNFTLSSLVDHYQELLKSITINKYNNHGTLNIPE